MTKTNIEVMEVNGVQYVRADSVGEAVKAGPKNRHVMVLDRGWIIAGDLEEVLDEDGAVERIKLGRPVLVRHWSSIGISGVLKDPKSDSVTLEVLPSVPIIPIDVELFRFPVNDDWGL